MFDFFTSANDPMNIVFVVDKLFESLESISQMDFYDWKCPYKANYVQTGHIRLKEMANRDLNIVSEEENELREV